MDLLRTLPIGLYLEKPQTWLHRLDPRVKLVWLFFFLLSPLQANPYWRLAICAVLALLTLLARIPKRVWRQQLGLLTLFCVVVFLLTCIFNDGLNFSQQPRLPDFVSESPLPLATDYQYVVLDLDTPDITVTRRSLDLAIRVGSLLFTLIYATNLYLLTTAPEEITAGIETLLQPLRRLNVPVTEIVLTLTLALRFIPLVLEEIQNLARSLQTRSIAWKKIGLRGQVRIWLSIANRLLENLLLRAEQIAIAMDARGFMSPNRHKVEWHSLDLGITDGIVLSFLVPFLAARFMWGGLS
ncbi:MAG: CbiQ family ECF transporter T component [Cyanobacteria bacterium J06641_5]